MADAFQELADAMPERIDALVDGLTARWPPDITAWFDARPELRERNREFTRESILAELECLRDGARVPASIPPVDAELARVAAQLDAPLTSLLWGYRNGHRVQWEAWAELVEATDLPPGERRTLLDRGAAFFFDYVDRLSDLVTAEHTRQRERLLRGLEQRRMQVVHRLLSGDETDVTALDYDADAHHLGVIALGEGGAAAAHALAAALDRRALLLAADRGLWWAWLGGARPLDDAARAALRRWSPEDGVTLALGGETAGREGFRETHREAAAALVAGQRTGAPVTHFADIALEALATRDEAAAHAFARRELTGLDGADHRSRQLRATLRAWFAAGQNAAAAAGALGIHEQTVAQRLRSVEERIGRPAAARRAELETALRVRHYLGASD